MNKIKYIGVLLALLMVLQNSLTFVFYIVERNECRAIQFSKKNNGLKDRQFHYFVFKQDEKIPWEIVEKEICIKGYLYDVIDLSYINDLVLLKCYKDKRETNIVHHYKLINKQQNNTKRPKHGTKKLLRLSGVLAITPPIDILGFCESSIIFHCISKHSQDTYADIFKPPPAFL